METVIDAVEFESIFQPMSEEEMKERGLCSINVRIKNDFRRNMEDQLIKLLGSDAKTS